MWDYGYSQTMVSMFLSVVVTTSSCGGMTLLNEIHVYYILYPNCGSNDDIYLFIIYQGIVATYNYRTDIVSRIKRVTCPSLHCYDASSGKSVITWPYQTIGIILLVMEKQCEHQNE
jgi:hypothetical protein